MVMDGALDAARRGERERLGVQLRSRVVDDRQKGFISCRRVLCQKGDGRVTRGDAGLASVAHGRPKLPPPLPVEEDGPVRLDQVLAHFERGPLGELILDDGLVLVGDYVIEQLPYHVEGLTDEGKSGHPLVLPDVHDGIAFVHGRERGKHTQVVGNPVLPDVREDELEMGLRGFGFRLLGPQRPLPVVLLVVGPDDERVSLQLAGRAVHALL